MVYSTTGDILQADVEALVNPVNCVGVMGRGLAKQFRAKYLAYYMSYSQACLIGYMIPGLVSVYKTNKQVNPKYIISFPTKRHWRDRSRIADIEWGLHPLKEKICAYGLKSIAIPPLGCGLGGLQWSAVKPLIMNAFQDLPDVDVYIYEPGRLFNR